MSVRHSLLPAYSWWPEPDLMFHPTRREDRTAHPLRGLINFGPYSRALINQVIDPIRVAFLTPHGALHSVDRLLTELEQRHQPRERRAYLPAFLGFSRVFGLRVVRAPSNVCVELSPEVDSELNDSPNPHLTLAGKLTQALTSLITNRSDFDVLLIYLPSKWSMGFEGREDEDFDLHDYIKAITASSGIPVQIVLEDSAMSYFCRCSVMWRLGIALYCKAGGVPWKLADTEPDIAYIGLSYAVRASANNIPRFVTCCSQVFDADGAGLEFIAYETDDVHIERDNPFLTRSDMRRVMARSLALYQNRHAGRSPKRVVVHKSTEFKPDEIEGCFDSWKAPEGLELVQIKQDVRWRGILIDPPRGREQRGRPAGYPCRRGTYLQLSGRDVLLWTQGNAPSAVDGRNFYKEGKGIPSPLMLTRFAGHGAWDEGCRHVLGLTKMDWNNDSLYDRLPITLSFAKTLAQVIKRMPSIAPKAYESRFFM